MRGDFALRALGDSTMTWSPSRAPCRSRSATSTEYQWPGSSGSTRAAVPRSRVPNAADALRRIAGTANQARDAPSAFVHADREHFDPVAVHQGRRVGPRQHQGRGAVVRQHQHIAVGAAAHPPGNPFALARRREAVRSLDRLAVAHHGRQAFGQARRAARSVFEAETLGEPRRGQRLGRFRQMLEQQLAARDGIRIARFLEFQIGVLAAPIRGRARVAAIALGGREPVGPRRVIESCAKGGRLSALRDAHSCETCIQLTSPRSVRTFLRLAEADPSCPGGGTGRRAGFRYQWSNSWRFESSPGHH